MVYIGIDPGKNGGYAVIDEAMKPLVVQAWDDEGFISAMQSIKADDCICCLEKVGAMPGQGVSSMFNFGKSAGFIEGVLRTCRIPYQLVPPRKWKKEFSLGSDKDDSISVCKRLFPNASLMRTERCTKESDGLAEALLMAEYARRVLTGN